jgi:hypothetical protein
MKLRRGPKYETLLFIQHILQRVDVKNLLACGRMPELSPSPNIPVVHVNRIQVEYRTYDRRTDSGK